MKCFDHCFPGPEENLACDEVLLEYCDNGRLGPLIRFWEAEYHFVVAGYANKIAREVNLDSCQTHSIPVFRRCTGGGTVLQGPGCLNYSLLLPITPGLENVTATNRYIMSANCRALEEVLGKNLKIQGDTDLSLEGRKFSGNAQRRKRNYLLFHGTFLLKMDLEKIERFLKFPSRSPDYREGRGHRDFLLNLRLDAELVRSTLKKAWGAGERCHSFPIEEIQALGKGKYRDPAWTFRS